MDSWWRDDDDEAEIDDIQFYIKQYDQFPVECTLISCFENEISEIRQ